MSKFKLQQGTDNRQIDKRIKATDYYNIHRRDAAPINRDSDLYLDYARYSDP